MLLTRVSDFFGVNGTLQLRLTGLITLLIIPVTGVVGHPKYQPS